MKLCSICRAPEDLDATGLCFACAGTTIVDEPCYSDLKLARIAHDMTQVQAAKLFGVSHRTWCRWEIHRETQLCRVTKKLLGWA